VLGAKARTAAMGSTCCRADPTSTEFEVEATPNIFEIVLAKRGNAKIGLDLTRYSNEEESFALRIETVRREGLASEWNAKHPSAAVKEGDLITKCNGKAGKPQDLLRLLVESSELSLTIMRPQLCESAEDLELETNSQSSGSVKLQADSTCGASVSTCASAADGAPGARGRKRAAALRAVSAARAAADSASARAVCAARAAAAPLTARGRGPRAPGGEALRRLPSNVSI